MKLRDPQRMLFDGSVAAASVSRWNDGALIGYLGDALKLKLDTDRREAACVNHVLHLPLPPDASARQIQDAAGSWLRREAETLFSRLIASEIGDKAAQFGCRMPKVTLSFSLRGSWIKVDGQVTQSFSMGLFIARVQRGSHILLEQTCLGDSLWVPKRLQMRLSAKILLLKSLDLDRILTYSDYRPGADATYSVSR